MPHAGFAGELDAEFDDIREMKAVLYKSRNAVGWLSVDESGQKIQDKDAAGDGRYFMNRLRRQTAVSVKCEA